MKPPKPAMTTPPGSISSLPCPMEIIWGNRTLHRGDWKYFGEPDSKNRFPHYVARGGGQQTGRWHDESVDLVELYETQWGSAEGDR